MDTMVEINKKRIEWCDIYKAIVIILVVIGHSAGGVLTNIIYQFHMAAFFWISGYTANNNKKSFWDYMVKKFCKLMLPFYFIVFCGDLIYYVANKLGVLIYFSSMDVPTSFSSSISGFLTGTAIYCDVLGAMWFIPVMFISGMIFKILIDLFDDKPWSMLAVSICLCVLGEYLALNHIQMYNIDLAAIAQYYMTIGYLFKRSKMNVITDKYYKIILLVMVVIYGILFGLLNIRLSMDWPSRSLNGCFDLILPIMGIVTVMCLSKLLELNRKICEFFSYIGRKTYGIMCFHFIGFKVSYLIFVFLGQMTWLQFSYLTPGGLSIRKYWLVIDVIAIAVSILMWNLISGLKRISIFFGKSDELQNAILESSIHNQINDFFRFIKGIVDGSIELVYRWKKIIAIVAVASFVGWGISSYRKNQMDVQIVFPDNTNRVEYEDGWLPQSSGENYRWVMQSSEIKVRLADQKNIKIHGFVPASVTDMSQVILYVNGQEIYTEKITSEQEIDIQVDAGSQLKQNHMNLIELEFDGLYVPGSEDADQRSFSALIDSIIIE